MMRRFMHVAAGTGGCATIDAPETTAPYSSSTIFQIFTFW